MHRSPLAMDQRACPSFIPAEASDPAGNGDSLTGVLRTLPLSLRPFSPQRAFSPNRPRRLSPSPRAGDVYASLTQRAAMARERLESARAVSIRRSLSACRPTPRISAVARAMPRPADIVDRLSRLRAERLRLDAFRRAVAEREETARVALFFAPAITDRARHAEGRALKESASVRRRDARRDAAHAEAARRRRTDADCAEHTAAPRINARSAALAQRARARSGTDGMAHADGLMAQRGRAQLAQWERTRAGETFAPRITAYAAALTRDGDTTHRLHAAAQRKTETAKETETEKETEMKRVKAVRASGAGDADGSTLAEREGRYQTRRAAKIRAILESERRLHTPTLDPVSEMIAAGLPVSATERLTTGRTRRETSGTPFASSCASSRSVGPNAGAEEYKSPPSSPLAAAKAKCGVFERMQQWQRRREERLEQLRSELHESQQRQRDALHEESRESCSMMERGLESMSPIPREGKVLPMEDATPRALTVGRNGSPTPIVLSLAPMKHVDPNQ